MHIRSQHATPAIVALASFGVALDQGGFGTGFLAGAAFAIWWLVLLAVILSLPNSRATPIAAVLTGASLAALGGWTALSWLWASDDGLVFVEIVRVLGYLGLFTLVVLAGRSDQNGARGWLAGLTIGLTAIALMSLGSRFFPSLIHGGVPDSRLNYPIGYWNGLAACAALAAVLLAWHAAHSATRLARSLATAGLPSCALAIFLSGSRGGVAAAALGLIVLFALLPKRFALLCSLLVAAAGGVVVLAVANGQAAVVADLSGSDATSQGRELFGVAIVVALVVGWVRYQLDEPLARASVSPRLRRWAVVAGALVLVGLVVAENPVKRFDQFKEPPERAVLPVGTHFTSDNGSGRYQFWDAALDAFGHEPLHGIGAGQYGTWWNRHGSIYYTVRDAHSLLFETAAELGAVGLALIVLFLGIPIRSGWRARAGPRGAEAVALLALLATGLLSAAIDWMWELPGAFGPVVVAAALLTGGAIDGIAQPPVAARRMPALGLATVAVAWVALLCSGDLLFTQVKLDQSHSAAAAGNLTAAADDAEGALALAPWSSEPRLQLGLVQELQGDLPAARQSLEEAASRAPHDWHVWFILSRIERRAGNEDAASSDLERALQENPRSPFLRRTVGLRQLRLSVTAPACAGTSAGGGACP
jgi:hypothetical protein